MFVLYFYQNIFHRRQLRCTKSMCDNREHRLNVGLLKKAVESIVAPPPGLLFYQRESCRD